MWNKPATWLGALTSISLLAGCGGGSPATGDGTSVVAGFYPLAYVAERVAGDHAAVTNLTPAGAEAHDLELSPRQTAEVSEADVVIHEQGFQPSLDEAAAMNESGVTLEVTEIVPLEDTGGGADDHGDHGGHDHGGEESHGDQEGHDHGEEDGHAHEEDLEGDPHIWQDPTKLIEVAHATADALAEADPDHAEDYRNNAEGLERDLTRLDEEFAQGLANCDRRTFVTSHAAFSHLAQRYDLEMIPISGLSPGQEPSLARLSELEELAEDEGVTTVFAESSDQGQLSDTLADEVGISTDVLYPIESLTDETADEDYLSLMRSNLESLRAANGCR